jgi:hypothetical protein
MVEESPVEVAEEIREKVMEAPPREVMPTVEEKVKPAEVEEEEEEETVKKKKGKVAREIPEERPPKKRLLKRRVFGEAEPEVEKRYPRGPRQQPPNQSKGSFELPRSSWFRSWQNGWG